MGRLTGVIAVAAATVAGVVLSSPVAGAGAAKSPGRSPSLGLLLDVQVADGVPAPPAPSPDHPVLARLVARWDEVESEKGVFDWSRIAPAVERLASAGLRVALCLTGSNALHVADGKPPSPLEGESLQAWTDFVRSSVRTFAGQVQVFEIWDGPARPLPGGTGSAFEPAIYAFVLKSSALAIRAEARAAGAEVQVSEGPISASDLAWQEQLWQQDAAAYLDVLPVLVVAGSGDIASNLDKVFTEAVQHPPAPVVWAYVETDGGTGVEQAIDSAVEALAAPTPATAAFARVEGEGTAIERAAGVLYALHAEISGFSPAPHGQMDFVDDQRLPIPGARALGRFLADSDEDFTTRIVYDSPGAGLAGQQGWLVVDAPDVRDALVIDPVTGGSIATVPSRVPGEADRRALKVVFASHPMILSFKKAPLPKGLELPTEQLQVATTRGLTAEEIIARNQAVQKVQDDRLDRWIASARVNYHFKLAQAGSAVDVAIDSRYFWERGAPLEWEHVTYYVNGNKVTWKSIPEIPYVQPDKVVTLPLDLTLDRTYLYRLRGEDEVEGRAAYVLEFDPANPDAPRSLYHGRVWIDKLSFVRLKASLIQTNLEPPVVSNEETDLYKPFSASDGGSYWLLSRIDGQQLWTIGGRNLVVHREMDFSTYDINLAKPAFVEARKEAYASTHLMMQDTDKGYRYMERQADGTRTVRAEPKSNLWFAAAGAFEDNSRSSPLPLAGANYLDTNLSGRNDQLNVLFAGVVAFLNYSDPAVFGKRIDLTVEGAGIAVKGDDKVYKGTTEIVSQRVETRSQYLSFRLGFPATSFAKFTVVADFYDERYYESSDATHALAAENAANGTSLVFVLPQDHEVLDGTVQAEISRHGYTLTAAGSWSWRSKWAPWGVLETSTGTYVDSEYDPSQKTSIDWNLTGFKEWYLPNFQKLRLELDYLDGQRLDRFSRYQFSLFGAERLNGFAGTGVRFDRGFVGRVGYSFNLFEVIRFDLSWDSARILDRRSGAGYQDFGGASVSANVVGPWKTVISGSYGRAIVSDIPDLKGSQEFMLLVLKLF